MKKLFVCILLLGFCGICAVRAQNGVRRVESLNFGWRFHAGDVEQAEMSALNDGAWLPVCLPHDFQIAQPWVPPSADEKADLENAVANVRSHLSSRGFKEMGCGWYRKRFMTDPTWKGRRVLLDFGGIMLFSMTCASNYT